MSLYPSATLTDPVIGFPVDTEAHFISSLAKLEQSFRDGVMDSNQVRQVLTSQIGPFLLANAEAAPNAPTAVYTGTAGTTSRYYAAIPAYPLVPGPGNAGANAGKFLQFLAGLPPGGRPGSIQKLRGVTPSSEQRTARYGLNSAAVTVANTAAALSSTAYVTVTAPAYSGIGTGVKFDIIAVTSANVPIYAVARGVAPGGTCVDNGSDDYQGTENAFRGTGWPDFPGVCVGPTSGVLIYGSTTTAREA